jgi:hypothetical protein
MKTFLNNKVIILLKLVATIIMLQTLFFKFTASPESVYIFSTLGLEPVGRIGIGVLELVASILILVPATTIYGAILGAGLMGGALMSHFTKLGIVVMDDGGQLFIYALLVLISCGLLALNYREKVYDLIKLNDKYRA